MVKKFSQLYLEARRAFMEIEDQQTASLLARNLLCYVSGKTQEHVTGTVKLKLYKGNVMYAGRRSPNSLYSYAMATMEADYTEEDYNQDDASGFIHLNGLRLKQFARVNNK